MPAHLGPARFHSHCKRTTVVPMGASQDDRRTFLKSMATLPVLPVIADSAPQTFGARTLFNAIQMGPHTMLDEGIDHCLDLIQETAAINALMIYSHTYHGDIRKPPQMLATDHGVAPREMRNRNLPAVWIKPHEQYYKDTTLRHQIPDSSYEYAARDLFQEVQEPARKRGMKVYARICDRRREIAPRRSV